MSHLDERGEYDPATKTLNLARTTENTHHPNVPKLWEVDPQVQIIALLTDIKSLLGSILKHTVPYHTGQQTVSVPAPKPFKKQG